ncbi:hypothetical protein J7E62_04955 [Variovorax paradoxus]|nr:hypothetical protein [Variovorax paradoxus]
MQNLKKSSRSNVLSSQTTQPAKPSTTTEAKNQKSVLMRIAKKQNIPLAIHLMSKETQQLMASRVGPDLMSIDVNDYLDFLAQEENRTSAEEDRKSTESTSTQSEISQQDDQNSFGQSAAPAPLSGGGTALRLDLIREAAQEWRDEHLSHQEKSEEEAPIFYPEVVAHAYDPSQSLLMRLIKKPFSNLFDKKERYAAPSFPLPNPVDVDILTTSSSSSDPIVGDGTTTSSSSSSSDHHPTVPTKQD